MSAVLLQSGARFPLSYVFKHEQMWEYTLSPSRETRPYRNYIDIDAQNT